MALLSPVKSTGPSMSFVGVQGLLLQRMTVALCRALPTDDLLPLVRTALLIGAAELIRTLARRWREAAMANGQLMGGRPPVSMIIWNEVLGPVPTELRIRSLIECMLS